MTKSVVAVVANVKRFRLPFYRLLAEELLTRGVDLKVVYSDPDSVEALKCDSVDLPAPVGVRVKARYLFGNRALVQIPPLRLLARADLVIVVQASSYLLNYFLLPMAWFGIKSVAFWGHGFNHQGDRRSLTERLKRLLATKVHWWFTYTQATGGYLIDLGFPADRITVIENAPDTRSFAREVASVGRADTRETRRVLGIPDEACVGLFCGSLYAEKKLDFLIRVGDDLYQKHPNFRMIVIGSGPESGLMRDAVNSRTWLYYCGPQFGLEKARLFAAADVFINPGLVGLAILDSFAAGLPFVTSTYEGHSPEIAYLEHGHNGLLPPLELRAFAEGVERLILNDMVLQSLRRGARAASGRYTVENMVRNVASGIYRCLRIG